ncbi:hypothetical protein BGZ60DRAFT_369675, partial [Tricladium varicosporioides]
LALWIIFPALYITPLLLVLEGTIGTTTPHFINRELNAQEDYVWIINEFYSQAQLSLDMVALTDIFSLRWVVVSTVLIFILGSGIRGGATSTEMLITG